MIQCHFFSSTACLYDMRGAEKAVEQYIGTDIEVDIAAEGEVVVDIHVGIGIDDLAGLLGR